MHKHNCCSLTVVSPITPLPSLLRDTLQHHPLSTTSRPLRTLASQFIIETTL
eukprot:m.138256 g.138256  ORF g.138256 m.138256 type:complete len:52 (-) comp14918_c1_seq10:41-196(-)